MDVLITGLFQQKNSAKHIVDAQYLLLIVITGDMTDGGKK